MRLELTSYHTKRRRCLPFSALRSSPVLGEWGLWILPSALPPMKACLMLRDWREVLGEGSDLLVGALVNTKGKTYTYIRQTSTLGWHINNFETKGEIVESSIPHHVVFFDLSTDQVLACYSSIL